MEPTQSYQPYPSFPPEQIHKTGPDPEPIPAKKSAALSFMESTALRTAEIRRRNEAKKALKRQEPEITRPPLEAQEVTVKKTVHAYVQNILSHDSRLFLASTQQQFFRDHPKFVIHKKHMIKLQKMARNDTHTGLLQYASPELKNDFSFVLKMVKLNGSNLEFVSQRLQLLNDKEIITAALEENPDAEQFMTKAVLKSKKITKIWLPERFF